MPNDEFPAGPRMNRRAAVAAFASLGVAGLSGCGGPSADGPSSTPPGLAPPLGTAPRTLGPAADVPVGGGRVFETAEVVVTQPVAGDFRGFSAVCTHTACIVNTVSGGTVNCPCHGSRYHLDGTVAAGPAPRALDDRPVVVVDGQLVLK